MNGLNDFNQSAFDADQARYNRNNRMYQPEFQPGMEPNTGGSNMDIFQQNVQQGGNTNIFEGGSIAPPQNTGDIFSSGISSPNNMFGQQQFGMNTMQPSQNGVLVNNQPQATSFDDELWKVTKNASQSSWNAIKDITKSFGNNTSLFYANMGKTVTIVAIGISVIGLLGSLTGVDSFFHVGIGGLASGALGFFVMMVSSHFAEKNQIQSEYKTEIPNVNPEQQAQQMQQQQQQQQMNFQNNLFNGNQDPFDMPSSSTFDFNEGEEEEDFTEDWGDDDWFSDEEEEDEDGWDVIDVDNVEEEVPEAMSIEDALNSMPEVPNGMYERQFLFDQFVKVLPSMNPNFSNWKEYDEESDVFLYWDELIQSAVTASGYKGDDSVDLMELKENLFTFRFKLTKPAGLKIDVLANELANIYAYNDGEFKEGVFAKADSVATDCYITLFTGAVAMISLKDMMLKEKEYILDSSHYLPITIGIDQKGKVIVYDFKKIESIIVTGMPRSGKSWFVQAVLTQMCAFTSPKEVNFYICDPKGGISDYKALKTPHVKKFVTEDREIVATLRNLVKVEGPRRKAIIGDADFVNIWDYKERYPDVELPIIYVVVDEIVSLSSRMDKEENIEFRMLLRELISQLPALGIRAFLIPHILNNEIIEKKTSDLVNCKISIMGNADHIEKATGSKPKDFPYVLNKPGDMAVRMPLVSNHTMYIHAPALTDSNTKNNELFDYIRRCWIKLIPGCDKDSVGRNADIEKESQVTLQKLGIDDSQSLDIDDMSLDDLF